MRSQTKEGIRRRESSRRFPRGGWEVRWIDPEGMTKRKTLATRDEAVDFRDQVKRDIREGTYIDPNDAKQTIRTYAQKWFEAAALRPTTRAAYGAMLQTYIYPGIGNVRLNQVTRNTLMKFKDRLDDLHRNRFDEHRRLLAENREKRGKESVEGKFKPLTETRKAHVFQLLSTIFNTAIRDEVLKTNPMTKLSSKERPKRNGSRKLILEAGQVDALANAVDSRFRTLVYFFAYSGLRAGEVAALRIEDVDLDEATVHVDESISDVKGKLEPGKPKTEASERTVALPAFIAEMLREQIGDRALDRRAFVFPGANDQPMRMSNFRNRHFRGAVLKALPSKLHGLTLHDLRHTAASLRYLASGGNMKVVQEVLGHSNFQTTANIYTQAFASVHKSTADALDAIFKAASGSPAAPDATVTELPR